MDTSVRNPNSGGQRMADALLRATAGCNATLLMPPLVGDTTDGGQLGVNAPELQQLSLGPAVFRRSRATMREGGEPRYELMVSASAIAQQVSAMQLNSADALLTMAAGVIVSGELFAIEGWSSSQSLGQAYVYRVQLRVGEPQSLTDLS